MTAEVIIMNKSAAVLAADSASTVTGGTSARYFKGVNKIFQLSNHHPVGVMIYNSSALHGVPWENLIKDFRTMLGDRSFRNLRGYVHAFFHFISDHPTLPAQELSNRLFPRKARDISHKVASDLLKQVVHEFWLSENFESFHSEDAKKKRKKAINEDLKRRAALASKKEIPIHFNSADMQRLTDSFEEGAELSLKSFLEDTSLENLFDEETRKMWGEGILPSFQREVLDAIDFKLMYEICVQEFFKNYEQFCSYTGLVFAGYGDEDHFPSFQEHICYGFIAGKLIRDENFTKEISRNMPSYVQPFATKAMMETFIMGMSDNLHVNLRESLEKNLLKSLTPVIADLLEAGGSVSSGSPDTEASSDDVDTGAEELKGEEEEDEERSVNLPDELKEKIDKVAEKLTDDWLDPDIKKQVSNLFEFVQSLPVGEMARFAETLVNLESVKERVDLPSESVGGPVDVAVISKGDGFIWVKRKHYFKPELNPRYFDRIRG